MLHLNHAAGRDVHATSDEGERILDLGEDAVVALFDELRYKRNSLVYYGKRMGVEDATLAITRSKRLLQELQQL